jgi:hypothetical protein
MTIDIYNRHHPFVNDQSVMATITNKRLIRIAPSKQLPIQFSKRTKLCKGIYLKTSALVNISILQERNHHNVGYKFGGI